LGILIGTGVHPICIIDYRRSIIAGILPKVNIKKPKSPQTVEYLGLFVLESGAISMRLKENLTFGYHFGMTIVNSQGGFERVKTFSC